MSDIMYYGIFPQITDTTGKTATDYIINKNGKPVFQDYCGAHSALQSRDPAVQYYNCTEHLKVAELK